jgi:hypothetical protein
VYVRMTNELIDKEVNFAQCNHKEAGNMGLLVHWLPSLYVMGGWPSTKKEQ